MNDQLYEVLWGSLEVAMKRSSLGRSTLYNLMRDGAIRSRVIKRKNARGAGHRLIDIRSLDEFIENSPSDVTPEVRARNRKAVAVMVKAKLAKRQRDHDRDRDSRRPAAR
jgi:hypothetical protein